MRDSQNHRFTVWPNQENLPPTHLFSAFLNGAVSIVPVISPQWMTKIDHEITVVQYHRIVEIDFADPLPIGDRLSFAFGQ